MGIVIAPPAFKESSCEQGAGIQGECAKSDRPDARPPNNALRGDAPEIIPGWPYEKDGAWIQVEDHRDKQGYLEGQPHIIKELGPLPDGWSDTKPEKYGSSRTA